MKIHYWVIIGIFILPIMIDSAQSQNTEELFEEGINKIQERKFDEAINVFDQVLEIEPNHVGALNNKGFSLEQIGQYGEAINVFDQVLEIEPNHVGALNNKGNALAKIGQHGEAINVFDQVLEIEPNHVGALNNKGLMYMAQEKYYEAMLIFDKVVLIDPTNEQAYNNRLAAFGLLPYEKINAVVHIEIRDSNGVLVALLRSDKNVNVLGIKEGYDYLNRLPSEKTVEKDGQLFDFIQKKFERTSSHTITQSRSGVVDDALKVPVILTQYWGYMAEVGDSITTIYSIWIPVD